VLIITADFFSSLTNKLMIRVCNYFDTQLHVPIPATSGSALVGRPNMIKKFQTDPDGISGEKRKMSGEEMLVWYGKILDAVRMRYRKLQRFARRLTQRFDNSAEYLLEGDVLPTFISQLKQSGHFLVYTRRFEERGTYVIADGSLWEQPDSIRQILSRAFSMTLPTVTPRSSNRADQVVDQPLYEIQPEVGLVTSVKADDEEDEEDEAAYLLLLSPRQAFAWTGAVMTMEVDDADFALEDNRVRLIADGPTTRLTLCKSLLTESLLDLETGELVVSLPCLVEQQAHLPRIQRELRRIARSTYRLTESFMSSAQHVRKTLSGAPGSQEMVENWFTFASEHGKRFAPHVDSTSQARFTRLLMRLAIAWVSFICDSCDPTDRKTFRWTVGALRFALDVTEGHNILHLDKGEFSLLRKSVASLISLLISHFDILGARSSIEAKKEADRIEAMRRLQRLQENIDDDFLPGTSSPGGKSRPSVDRSLRLTQEQRLRLIAELEQRRVGLTNDQHLMGQVLDEQVNEDRALVFLAASSSNIALRWQQGAFIGGGANGNVYIGFNLDSGGIMAVKEIRVQDLTNSPTLYKQIKDESDVMSMLSHPNIVEYYGIEVSHIFYLKGP
jgi:mitogen-activated protein kinase kinase kinase